MPLLPTLSSLVNNPIYTDLFVISYDNCNLTKEEKIILSDNSYKIFGNYIYFNISIEIIEILKKLNIFNINLIFSDRYGVIIGKFIYHNCLFVDLFRNLIDFDWENTTILKSKIELKYDNIIHLSPNEFKNYERNKKLNRILKN